MKFHVSSISVENEVGYENRSAYKSNIYTCNLLFYLTFFLEKTKYFVNN